MRTGQYLLLTVFALFIIGTIFGIAYNIGKATNKPNTELAVDAAAEQYKSQTPHDTIKLIDLGVERFQKTTHTYLLPQNSRTKGALLQTKNPKKTTNARKRAAGIGTGY